MTHSKRMKEPGHRGMALRRVIISLVACCSVALSLQGAVFKVSENPASGEKRNPLSVTTNDVLLIHIPSGATAVVQFTRFDTNKADYRWRYRAAGSQAIESGRGRMIESYERKAKGDGNYEVRPKADQNTTVKAGEIWIEWSPGGTGKGWLYYYPSRASIQVLKSGSFERDL